VNSAVFRTNIFCGLQVCILGPRRASARAQTRPAHMPSPNGFIFSTTLELFVCKFLGLTHACKELPLDKWKTKSMRFLCSPSISESARLYHHFMHHKPKKEWLYFLIAFVDCGALLEFKHLLAHIGKDPFKLAVLQWLISPDSVKEQPATPDFLLVPVIALPSSRIIADITW
jgi:hypothetical protein